jgi:histidinol dehydrogenase
MIRVCETSEPAFESRLKRIVDRGKIDQAKVKKTVRAILERVRKEGDRALIHFTETFDGVRLDPSNLRVPPKRVRRALGQIAREDLRSLRLAARRTRAFHQKQLQRSWGERDSQGIYLGQKVGSLDRVGVYVPGGRAAYPSTVLMSVIPARVAGVKEICLVSPPSPKGQNPYILAAAEISGVTEVYQVGGAQAIAAMAFGTETIARVDKIVGPGNIYVATAKRLVFGEVDIDSVAGPSEIVVIADRDANPSLVAADLLSQAEHDPMASAICLTSSKAVARRVAEEVTQQIKMLTRYQIAEASIRKYGAIIVTRDVEESIEIANRIAPEHLELFVVEPRRWLGKVRHAGAVFLGSNSPEPLGDYLAGPSHVLPTGGTARFFSPLGVYDFQKRTSVIEASGKALASLAPHVIRLARLEGLEAHAEAVRKRIQRG